MNAANRVTLFRFLLIPVLMVCLIHEFFVSSAILICVLAFSDLLDGYLARRLNEITKLGMLLDPLADKILIVSLFIFFVYHNELPMWFMLAMVYRDFSLLFGVLTLKLYHRTSIVPSQGFGKLSTALNLTLAFFLCVNHVMPLGNHLLWGIIWMALLATVGAFFSYSFRWFHLFQGEII